MLRAVNRSLFALVLGCMLMLAFAVALHSCGPAPAPAAAAEPSPKAGDPAWAALAPLVKRDCGTCHNGTEEPAFTSGAQFKASTAKARLLAGTMPPSGHEISASDKQAMLDYLGK